MPMPSQPSLRGRRGEPNKGKLTVESNKLAVSNLLYRYAELIDSGDFLGAADLFRSAKIKIPGGGPLLDSAGVLALWKQMVRVYPCGTPRTKHVITNPIVELNDSTAKVRSYYTVYQATEDFPLQLICAGRYHDEFECVDGLWRYMYRDYSLLDLTGDMSAHLKPAVRQ